MSSYWLAHVEDFICSSYSVVVLTSRSRLERLRTLMRICRISARVMLRLSVALRARFSTRIFDRVKSSTSRVKRRGKKQQQRKIKMFRSNECECFVCILQSVYLLSDCFFVKASAFCSVDASRLAWKKKHDSCSSSGKNKVNIWMLCSIFPHSYPI